LFNQNGFFVISDVFAKFKISKKCENEGIKNYKEKFFFKETLEKEFRFDHVSVSFLCDKWEVFFDAIFTEKKRGNQNVRERYMERNKV